MMKLIYIIVILLPILGGVLVPILDFHTRKGRELFIMSVVTATSILCWVMLGSLRGEALTLYHLTHTIDITLRLDGMGSVFVVLVSVLWPLACLYAFEYMEYVHKKNQFFMFYTMSYGITLGVALSANLITMYLFYEMLTLCTFPLVGHEGTNETRAASNKYLVYSMAGATAAFIGIIVILTHGGSLDYSVIGFSPEVIGDSHALFEAAFLFMFFGFGVKAAICPLHGWLPTAGVAPTPVTALLHAVAVVKSGVFAIARVIYYTYGTEFLQDTPSQRVGLLFTAFTIVYGTVMAWREIHFKKRLAYSTISNLSYIVFAFMLMTPEGLQSGLMHMVFHGIIKISLFFVAGAVIHTTERKYVTQLKGFARKMPISFGAFTIASLGLMGVPPLCGFLSKYAIAEASVQLGGFYGGIGVAALLVSAMFTAMYLMTIVIRAYFPPNDFDMKEIDDVKEVNWYITLPLCILCIAIIVLGINATGLMKIIHLAAMDAFPGLGF